MTPLQWVRVSPPDGYRSAWAALDGLRIYRAIKARDGGSWRLELIDVKVGIDWDLGGISHEKTFQDCKDQLAAAPDRAFSSAWRTARSHADRFARTCRLLYRFCRTRPPKPQLTAANGGRYV